MYQLNYHLKSLSPYIQNNPVGVVDDVRNATGKTRIGKADDNSAKTGYRNDKGYYIPARQIDGVMFRAGMKVKLGKANIAGFMKSCVFPEGTEFQLLRGGKPIKEPDFIYNDPIITKEGKMVFNPRVAFNDWEADVLLNIVNDSIPKEKVKEVLVYGGLYVGIGSRRPRYGRFMVI